MERTMRFMGELGRRSSRTFSNIYESRRSMRVPRNTSVIFESENEWPPLAQTGNKQDQQTGKDKKTTAKFSKWVQGLNVAVSQGSNSQLFPVEMEPFAFSRLMDISSPLLFQNCFQTKPFDSATIVKRKRGIISAIDSRTALTHVPYLRIDFKNVLLISVDWDGGDMMKEKYKFVSRSVTVKYRQQNHDGSKGAVIGGTELSLQKAT